MRLFYRDGTNRKEIDVRKMSSVVNSFVITLYCRRTLEVLQLFVRNAILKDIKGV